MKTKAIPTHHLTDAQVIRTVCDTVGSLLKLGPGGLCNTTDVSLDDADHILKSLNKGLYILAHTNSPGAGLITAGATIWIDYTLGKRGISFLEILAPHTYKNMMTAGFKWLEHLPPEQQTRFLAELARLACLTFVRNFRQIEKAFRIFADNKEAAKARLIPTGFSVGKRVHPRPASPGYIDALVQAGASKSLVKALRKHP